MSYCLKKIISCFFFLSILHYAAFTQLPVSIATDVSILHNFSPHQKFWAFGQGVEANFHFSKKNTVYGWLNYHTKGSFTNSFIADAKSSATNPATIGYNVKGKWGMRQVSLGWKHFIKGSYNEENTWNLYAAAGFGLLFSNIQNTLLTVVDTSSYQLKPSPALGSGNFKRLTVDLSLGIEYPLTSGFFLYGDLRTSFPASDYPSPFFHDQQQVPLSLMFNTGIRILFGSDE